jgi:N-acetylglucosaminyl-diphospho-decaprenol L-rhamnosyltransferase
VLYNSERCVEASLASIRDDVRSGFAELIVVDNASPDAGVDAALRVCPEARVIRSAINRYYAGGCNLAWPYVRGRYWLLLNPDVVVPPGGLSGLVEWMDHHPEIGAASPDLADRLGRLQFPARRFPSLSQTLVEMLRLHRLATPERQGDFLLGSYWRGGEHLDVDWVVGAALIARREAVETAGLLSEALPMYAEDSEWCWRIRRAGFRIGLTGQAPWLHEGGQSTALTWEAGETTLRTWGGIYASCVARRGRFYTALLWLSNALAFAIESVHPRRPKLQRDLARAMLAAHAELIRRRWRR